MRESFTRLVPLHRNNLCRSLSLLTVITQCCIVELYKAGEERQPVVDLAKTFERRKCNHREAIEGDECVRSVVGAYFSCCFAHRPWFTIWLSRNSELHISSGDKNKHRYIIATQSQSLRNHLRTIPAVPIVHIKKSVMILEPPSDTTLSIKAEVCLSPLNLLSRLLNDGPLPTVLYPRSFTLVHPSPRRPKNPPCTPLHPNGVLCLSPLPNPKCHYGGRRRPEGLTL